MKYIKPEVKVVLFDELEKVFVTTASEQGFEEEEEGGGMIGGGGNIGDKDHEDDLL